MAKNKTAETGGQTKGEKKIHRATSSPVHAYIMASNISIPIMQAIDISLCIQSYEISRSVLIPDVRKKAKQNTQATALSSSADDFQCKSCLGYSMTSRLATYSRGNHLIDSLSPRLMANLLFSFHAVILIHFIMLRTSFLFCFFFLYYLP